MAPPKDAPGIKPPSPFDDEFVYPPVAEVFGPRPDNPGLEDLTWSEEPIPDIPGFSMSLKRLWESIKAEEDERLLKLGTTRTDEGVSDDR